jgi:hypothetical protein
MLQRCNNCHWVADTDDLTCPKCGVPYSITFSHRHGKSIKTVLAIGLPLLAVMVLLIVVYIILQRQPIQLTADIEKQTYFSKGYMDFDAKVKNVGWSEAFLFYVAINCYKTGNQIVGIHNQLHGARLYHNQSTTVKVQLVRADTDCLKFEAVAYEAP